MENLVRRAAGIANDRDAGAAELLAQALPLLADALAEGHAAVVGVAQIVCAGQPAMAPLWNACGAAVAERSQPGRFARVRAEMARAPAALERAARDALEDLLRGDEPPRLLTLSYSSSVARVLGALAAGGPLHVACGEGRPRYEGRRMAAELAAAGAAVMLTTDAALTTRLDGSSAVVVGADAFGHTHWINKTGTRGLAAAAHLAGVPVFVVCTRDKARPEIDPDHVAPEAPSAEVVEPALPGVQVANPYFESISVDLGTLFLTEAGPAAPGDLPSILDRYRADISLLIKEIRAQHS